MKGNLAIGFTCPECKGERAEVEYVETDPSTFWIKSIGFWCLICEHHWSEPIRVE